MVDEVGAVVTEDVVVLQLVLGVAGAEVAVGDVVPVDGREDGPTQLDVLERLVVQVEVDVLPGRALTDRGLGVGQVADLGVDVLVVGGGVATVDLTVDEGVDERALVGVEHEGDPVQAGLGLAEPLGVRLLDDLVLQVAGDDLVGATGPFGALGVQPGEVLAELVRVVDVPAVLLRQVGGEETARDVVRVEQTHPLGVRHALLEGDRGGLAVDLDALDLVRAGAGPGVTTVAVPLVGAGRHHPGDAQVLRGHRLTVTPDGVVGEGDRPLERPLVDVVVDEFGLLGEDVHVVLIGGGVGQPPSGARQDAGEHLDDVDAASGGADRLPGAGQGLDHPGGLPGPTVSASTVAATAATDHQDRRRRRGGECQRLSTFEHGHTLDHSCEQDTG